MRDSKGNFDLPAIGKLLPTPQAHDHTRGKTEEQIEAMRNRTGAGVNNLNEVVENKLLPTVTTSEATGAGHAASGGKNLRTVVSDELTPRFSAEDLEMLGEEPAPLLPTPRATRGGSSTETAYLLGGERSDDGRTQGEVLLPTPKAGDGIMGLPRTSGRPPERSTHLATRIHYTDFGIYAPAIERWEQVTGNPAPAPTILSARGKHRLSEYFTEWMMGLPAGWICDVPDISRNEKVKAAGNGVVPQQAYAALEEMRLRYEATVRDDILG